MIEDGGDKNIKTERQQPDIADRQRFSIADSRQCEQEAPLAAPHFNHHS